MKKKMKKMDDGMHLMPGGWEMPDSKMKGMMSSPTKTKSKKTKKASKTRKAANRK